MIALLLAVFEEKNESLDLYNLLIFHRLYKFQATSVTAHAHKAEEKRY